MSASKIKILPDAIINKIAAGEVVERPASVVKELVENAIDAGSSQITIEIKKAGKKLIRVSDNGEGIVKSDLLLALSRHATSKISNENDLYAVRTLGFRGEALASVAAVSQLEMFSFCQGEKSGAKIVLEGGRQVGLEDFGCPQGTTVEVKDLFFNTPARQKFLKADATEQFHIVDLVGNIILSHPEISFKLVDDGKTSLASTGSGSLKEALVYVFGSEIAGQFIPVEGVGVHGFISRPSVSRLDRKYQSFFVNGRCVKNFPLSRALDDALQNVIPRGRYPMAVIFIDIDPREIDVNVHPAKREIKFANQGEVMARLRAAVAQAVGNKSEEEGKGRQFLPCQRFGGNEWQADAAAVWQKEIAEPTFDFKLGEGELEVTPVPLYQIDNTYIIAVGPKSMILIDQHAAHERVLFDKLSQASVRGQAHSQKLLIPENVALTPAESKLLGNSLGYLHSLGFEIEVFGKDTFAVRAVPAILVKVAAAELIKDVVAEYADSGRAQSNKEKEDKILKMLACKGAVKAGQKLLAEEMKTLIKDLFATTQPHTCPHGRPTYIQYTTADLEKMFKRRGF
ncbi:MAG: DNA mismatch repair endonuclease MutL [Candidatus Margulisiibacteriota bacterium]